MLNSCSNFFHIFPGYYCYYTDGEPSGGTVNHEQAGRRSCTAVRTYKRPKTYQMTKNISDKQLSIHFQLNITHKTGYHIKLGH